MVRTPERRVHANSCMEPPAGGRYLSRTPASLEGDTHDSFDMPAMNAAVRRSRIGFLAARIRLTYRLASAVVVLAACRETRDVALKDSPALTQAPPSDSPTLVPVDSVVLAESDSLTLGLPSSLVVTGGREFYVSDVGLSQVVHFGRDGRPLGRVGRKGSGPGEYKAPTWLTLLGDSILLVKNEARLRVMAFATDSGRFLWERLFPGQTSSMHVDGSRMYVGLVDLPRRGSIGVMATGPGSSAPSDLGAIRVIGPLPELFARVPQAASVFGTVEVVAFGDTVASAYEVSNHVYLTRVDGSRGVILDSIDVPRIARRGARIDLFHQVTNDQASAMAAVYKSSIPFELARLSSGMLAYITFDPVIENQRITGTLFLSVIDPVRRRVCADALVPGQTDPPARAAFRGDTLFILSQEVVSQDQSRSIVRGYRVDVSRCRWR